MQSRRKPFRRRIFIRQRRFPAREKGEQILLRESACGFLKKLLFKDFPNSSFLFFVFPFFGLRFFTVFSVTTEDAGEKLARALLLRCTEDLGRRAFLSDDALVHENHAV